MPKCRQVTGRRFSRNYATGLPIVSLGIRPKQLTGRERVHENRVFTVATKLRLRVLQG